MTFQEIEQLVVRQEPCPGTAALCEQMCFFALRSLYTDYHRRAVDRQRAVLEKKNLAHAFRQAQADEQRGARLRDGWAQGILASDELRCRLHKAINRGEELKTLFLLACECIAAATGDVTFSPVRVMEAWGKSEKGEEARSGETERTGGREIGKRVGA